VASVEGFSTAAELAVLNLAARSLPPGEAYLEVGTFKGRSLCGAALDAPTCSLYGIENFMEFGMAGVDARTVLLANLATHADGTDLHLLEGDAFRLLRTGVIDRPVGVYFYDGVHTGEAHHLALALVEPLLADEAVVLIDDASWPMVARTTRRFVDSRPGWSVLRTFDAPTNDDPAWANGLMVLEFRREGAARGISATERARLAVQVSVRGPANALAWRTLQRFPSLVPLAKRAVPTGSRTVH
jgi:predicted O-methyltransferase YrrM